MIYCLLLSLFLAASTDQVVEKHIKGVMQEKNIPGVAVVLVKDGKPYFYEFGYANRERQESVTAATLFEIASITKVFTSTGVAYEVLEGRMNLNDPVVKYLPDLHGRDLRGIVQVKLVDLATHSSSLPRVPPPQGQGSSRAYFNYFAKWDPSYPIGTRYVYSNIGFGLLGDALAGAMNLGTYAAAIRQTVLDPLGMDSTVIHVTPLLMPRLAAGYNEEGKRVPHAPMKLWPGGGALKSTTKDMSRFLMANMGLSGPPKLQEAMKLAQKPIFKANDSMSLGLGWQNFTKNGLSLIDKNGGLAGSSSYIGFTKDNSLGIVILTNKGKTQITNTGRAILKELAQ